MTAPDAVPQDRASQLTREQLLDILQATEPHDEGGQPVVSMHHALFRRILCELDDDKRPLTFEEALEAQIKTQGFRLEHGPYAIGATNYRKGAEWAREWIAENE